MVITKRLSPPEIQGGDKNDSRKTSKAEINEDNITA